MAMVRVAPFLLTHGVDVLTAVKLQKTGFKEKIGARLHPIYSSLHADQVESAIDSI